MGSGEIRRHVGSVVSQRHGKPPRVRRRISDEARRSAGKCVSSGANAPKVSAAAWGIKARPKRGGLVYV